MSFISVVLPLSSLIYALLLMRIRGLWTKDLPNSKPSTPIDFSVIIPARNEAKNISPCIESILKNEYHLGRFEIIVIDDQSEDSTFALASKFSRENVRVLRSNVTPGFPKNGFKKWALDQAIRKAKYDHIVTIDADCKVEKKWLEKISLCFGNQRIRFTTGPVQLLGDSSFIEQFQALDNMGMMAVTKAGIESQAWVLANGANMAFVKEDYLNYSKSDNTKNIASGDDMFLAQYIQREHGVSAIAFPKSQAASVFTPSEKSWPSFISQRLRWASKNNKYASLGLNALMGYVWIYCLLTLVLLFISPLVSICALLFKALCDTIYLSSLSSFFKNKIGSLNIFFLSPFHTLYVAIFGFASLLPIKYTWKGRKVK